MAKTSLAGVWARSFERALNVWTQQGLRQGRQQVAQAKGIAQRAASARQPPPGPGLWLPGVAVGFSGLLRFQVYQPAGLHWAERVPLMVMLHGCHQDAATFAHSTRMNRLADTQRFIVLYPEQDRVANAHGCWNWFDTRSGRAYREAGLIEKAIEQVCLFYPADATRVALVGLSAGASMAALMATRAPGRFKAVVMHSGVPPGSADTGTTAIRAMRGRQLLTPLSTAQPLPPLMVIHGGQDRVVSSHNARSTANLWADATGAVASAPRDVQRGKRHAMTLTEYRRGGRPVVTLAEVPSLGHAWSGGAAKKPYSDPRGPDASRMAWAFAQRQFQA